MLSDGENDSLLVAPEGANFLEHSNRTVSRREQASPARRLVRNHTEEEHWNEWLTMNRDEEIISRCLEEAKSNDNKKMVPTTFHVAGLAIEKIWWTLPMLWITAVAMPFIGLYSSTCPCKGHVFGEYTGRYVWSTWFVVWALTMWREREALKLVILPCCAMMVTPEGKGLFKGPCGRCSCRRYTTWITFVSGLAKLDLVSNGLVLSKVWMAYKCGDARKHMDVWRLVMEQSCLAPYQWFENLAFVATVIWALMFLQGFWALMRGKAWENRKIEYGWASEVGGYHTVWLALRAWAGGKEISQAERAYHADVLRTLALNARMVTLIDQNMEWTLARARQKLQEPTGVDHAIAMFEKECLRGTVRVWLFVMLEKGLMLDIQLTILAVSRHVHKHVLCRAETHSQQPYLQNWLEGMTHTHLQVDGQLLLGVAISFVTFFQVSGMHFGDYMKLRTCLAEFRASAKTSREQSDIAGAVRLLRLSAVAFSLCLCIILHCTAKFVAVFQCESAFWDMPITRSKHVSWGGCVSQDVFGTGE